MSDVSNRRHIPAELREELTRKVVRGYQAGLSTRALAADYGVHSSTIDRLLTEAGVERRARNAVRPKRSFGGPLTSQEAREYQDRLKAVRPGRKR